MSYVVPTNPVACISRQVAALVADLTVFAGLNVARVPDVLASTPADTTFDHSSNQPGGPSA